MLAAPGRFLVRTSVPGPLLNSDAAISVAPVGSGDHAIFGRVYLGKGNMPGGTVEGKDCMARGNDIGRVFGDMYCLIQKHWAEQGVANNGFEIKDREYAREWQLICEG